MWPFCNVALIHLRNDPVFAKETPSKLFEAIVMGLSLSVYVPCGEATSILNLSENAAQHGDFGGSALVTVPQHARVHQTNLTLTVLEEAASGRGHQAGRYTETKARADPIDLTCTASL
jgi:colanic acid biosynthesis glycosyl transferase WcaI